MGTPSAIEVCRADLFTRESELLERYPQVLVDKVLRIREMYIGSSQTPTAPTASL